jgi:hypothetical protein
MLCTLRDADKGRPGRSRSIAVDVYQRKLQVPDSGGFLAEDPHQPDQRERESNHHPKDHRIAHEVLGHAGRLRSECEIGVSSRLLGRVLLRCGRGCIWHGIHGCSTDRCDCASHPLQNRSVKPIHPTWRTYVRLLSGRRFKYRP